MRPLCIYHGHCLDGLAAAGVVHLAFDGQVDFHAGIYGEQPPDVTGRDVFVVDFSYPRAMLVVMAAEANSLTILDHHKSSREALENLPGAIVRWSSESPACMMTWRYFFHGELPPKILEAIEDYDLWSFKRQFTREIVAYLKSLQLSVEEFTQVMHELFLGNMIREGTAILRKETNDLDVLLPQLTRHMRIAGHSVPVANLPPTMASAAGHRLSADSPFAATYWDGPEHRTFSLRSREPDGADVSVIAQSYGGGGHKHAAGFRVRRQTAWLMECDE